MKRPDPVPPSDNPTEAALPSLTAISGVATVRDVARLSGVSVGTVSNVLNNRTQHIRPETRKRVLETARRLKYRPNGVARGLVQRRTRTIGVLFFASSAIVVLDPFTSAILHGVMLGTSPRGYSVLLFPQPFTNREKDLSVLADGRADGILVVAPERDQDTASALVALGVPVAVVSARMEGKEGIPSVDVDNHLGAYRATEYLLSLGHRHIAHLTGSEHQKSAHEREAGFRAAMAAAGVPVREDFVVRCGYHGGEAYEPTRRLLALPDAPTALFCANDNIAVGAMLAARDAKITIPTEFSVIGFDDAPAATLVSPPLSTIRQPLSEIGRRAAELLISRVENPEEGGVRPDGSTDGPVIPPIIYEPTLVVRGSTAAPPRHRM
jgi:LacI family transcriptional regulator